MANVLIILAHPLLEKSRVHAGLIKTAKALPDITVNDLYENYPDFDIDVDREKKLLLRHDIIIWQHPLHWYSAPPLLKQWQDLVLEHGWAYGKKGVALAGKKVFNVLTSGAGAETYQNGGFNKRSIHDYLRPFERTAELCNMVYWPPFWIDGVHRMENEEIIQHSNQYRQLLLALTNEFYPANDMGSFTLLNELVSSNLTNP